MIGSTARLKVRNALIALTTVSVVAAMGITSSPVAASPTDLPIVLDLQDLSGFRDTGGNPIAVIEDSASDTERTITGTGADDTPVEIQIYFGAVSTASAEDLVDLVNAVELPEDDLTPVNVDPATLAPQLAVATTPTTITVTWAPPTEADQFELLVDGEVVDLGPTPNFTLVGMEPDQAYSLTMRSSHSPVTTPQPIIDPTPECPEPITIHTTDLADWDLSETRSAGHNVLTATGLHVYTDEATSLGKAAGYSSTLLALEDVGVPRLDWDGASLAPGIQLVTDFNGDSTPDGILVGEQVYGDDYWLSNGSAQFVKDGAPLHGGGFGSDNHGTLDEWDLAFPDATVLAIGYSLGSGVLSDGVIESIAIGCTYYTFGLPVDESAVDTSMMLSVSTREASSGGVGLRGGSGLSSSVGSPIRSTEFNYRTFIPYPTLSESPNPDDLLVEAACIALNAGDLPSEHGPLSFIGDNRGYAAPRADDVADYRTMMTFRYDWESDSFIPRRSVGETRIVDLDSRDVLASKFADTSNMTFSQPVKSADYFAVTLSHVANDPFCPHLGAYGSIVYKVRVEMHRSGLITVTGLRANMPAHEGWVRWNDESVWSNVFALDANRLACLIGFGVPIVNIATDCIGVVDAATTRSTDRWTVISTGKSYFDSPLLTTTKSGRSYGWGSGHGGMLWPYTTSEFCTVDAAIAVPRTTEPGDRRVSTILSGEWNGTLISRDGRIFTWGMDAFGAANLGRSGNENLALPISGELFQSVDNYYLSSYAVSMDGDLYAWGRVLADWWEWPSIPTSWISPHIVASGYDFVQVSLGDGSVLALDSVGEIWGYGNNYNGLLGPRSEEWHPTWEQIPISGVTFRTIAIVRGTAMALDTTGRLWSWGSPRLTLDGSAPTQNGTPAPVETSLRFDYLHGELYFDAIDESGGLYRIDPEADLFDISEALLPNPGHEILTSNDRFAITTNGELLELVRSYDPVTEQYIEVWSNRGLPPTSVPTSPPMTCSYPG